MNKTIPEHQVAETGLGLPQHPVGQSAQSAKHPSVRLVEIDARNDAQRVDNFLISQLKGVPKSRIYRIIRKGEVRINKKRCKPETKLKLGDQVRIPPVVVAGQQSERALIGSAVIASIEQSIVFENAELIVVDKPSGLAVHGGSGVNYGLIEALRKSRGQATFLELVHRLDRDTSGVIIVAKQRTMLRYLHEQFRSDKVHKYYHLLVHGKWPRHQRVVDLPLKKNELKSGERVVTVHQDGKPSRTQFRILGRGQEVSLLEAKPITGRTHQIRVHAAHSGHPIVGDAKYSHKQAGREAMDKSRLMLHAHKLQLQLPDGTVKQFIAEYDQAFATKLRAQHLQHLPEGGAY